jgi:hypothetical protein
VPKLTGEQKLVGRMFDAYAALLRLGWKEADFAPKDGNEILVIEAGSSGIHKAIRDGDGDFWIWDNFDTDPSDPILWRPPPDPAARKCRWANCTADRVPYRGCGRPPTRCPAHLALGRKYRTTWEKKHNAAPASAVV